jgi:hypothetical protein
MKSANIEELSALSSVAGPQITRAEIETREHIQEMNRVMIQIAATSASERRKRSQEALQAVAGVSGVENKLAAVWSRATIAQRHIAVTSAGIPKERANDALAKFNAFEKTRMWTTLDELIDGLIAIQKCLLNSPIQTIN